ncbi:hypothetical protein U1Q18_052640 [Sarracenia purpurea var. burkii]
MELPREGNSTVRPPLLDGSNYAYWKARMRAFLKSIDEDVWLSVVTGYSPPTVKSGEDTIPKPVEQWDAKDRARIGWNNKAINAIFSGVTSNEFRRICTCDIAKDAWDILETTHEGTSTVKKSKLQKLTTTFETLRMEEDETFDEFYGKLSDVVNSSFILGEKIPESRIVCKILRSLPERFQPKVTAIEESKDIDLLKVEHLVGNLQTFESNLRQPKKSKGIALKSSKAEKDLSDNDTDSDSESVSLLVEKVRKIILKNQNKSNLKGKFAKDSGKGKNYTKIEKKKSNVQNFSIQCFECQGFGHIAQDCANKKKKKEKVLSVTWDDDSSSAESESEQEGEGGNYVAFTASASVTRSECPDIDSDADTGNELEQSDCESDKDNDDLQCAYDNLCKESYKLTKIVTKQSVKIKFLEKENSGLKSELENFQSEVSELKAYKTKMCEKLSSSDKRRNELLELCDSLKSQSLKHESESRSFNELQVSLEAKIKELEKELVMSNTTLKKLNAGSLYLEEILSAQKGATDRTGLGYVHEPSTSTGSGKINFVKAVNAHTLPVLNVPDGNDKNNGQKLFNSVKKTSPKFTPTFKQNTFRNNSQNNFQIKKFVPVCHYCGISGHIRPKCWDLTGKNVNFGRNMSNFTRIGYQSSQNRFWPLNDVRYDPPLNEKSLKTRSVWVRKEDLKYFVGHASLETKSLLGCGT